MFLSAIIITRNEAPNIARCLHSLQGIADEVIVIDSDSEDGTAAICQDWGARVYQHAFAGYGPQKRMAAAYATGDWLLSIDADEALSPALQQSILALKQTAPGAAAFEVNRLTNYCGKWIRHGGWYPDRLIRLWKKDAGNISNDAVHESWQPGQGKVVIGHLKGDLLHYSFPTLESHLKKVTQYARIGAESDYKSGKRVSLLKLWLGPKLAWWQQFVMKRGFLDGYYGFIIAKNSAFAAFAKYALLRELQKRKKAALPLQPSGPRSTMDSIRVSEAPDPGSIPGEATKP